MKLETAQLLSAHLEQKRFSVTPKEDQLEFSYDLSDDEILAIVETEYGTSITQSVPDLFRVIVKDLMKSAIEFAKKDANE